MLAIFNYRGKVPIADRTEQRSRYQSGVIIISLIVSCFSVWNHTYICGPRAIPHYVVNASILEQCICFLLLPDSVSTEMSLGAPTPDNWFLSKAACKIKLHSWQFLATHYFFCLRSCWPRRPVSSGFMWQIGFIMFEFLSSGGRVKSLFCQNKLTWMYPLLQVTDT